MRLQTRQAGFTLVEIMMATVLLALLMTLAIAGLRSSVRSANAGEEFIERTNRVRVAQELLRQQLVRSLPLAIQEEDETGDVEQIVFEGDDEYMRFVAPMPGYLGNGGPHIQALKIERGDNGRQLVFAHQMLNGYDGEDAFEDEERPPVVLIDNIKDGSFQYRTLDDEGELGDWLDEWDEPGGTPLVVRVELEMEEESRLFWPTMDIPLMIDNTSNRRRVIPRLGDGLQEQLDDE